MLSSKTLATQMRGISNTLIASRLLTTSFGNRHLRPTVVGAAVVASIDDLFPSCRRQYSTKSFTSTTRASSSIATNNVSNESHSLQPEFHPIYVHHVSRVALEHLQDSQSDWLVARGLDRNLQIRQNGTFILKFPEYGRIWTSYEADKRQHWLNVYRNQLAVRFLLKDHDRAAEALQQQQQTKKTKVQEYHASSIQKIQQAVDEMIKAVERIDVKEQAMEKKTTST